MTKGHPHYLTLSPVFPSLSKPGYGAPELLDHFHRALDTHGGASAVPVFALGGVDIGRLETLKTAGFSGAAILGSLWGSTQENPEALVKRAKIWAGASPWGNPGAPMSKWP